MIDPDSDISVNPVSVYPEEMIFPGILAQNNTFSSNFVDDITYLRNIVKINPLDPVHNVICNLSCWLPVCLSNYLSIYLSFCLSVYLAVLYLLYANDFRKQYIFVSNITVCLFINYYYCCCCYYCVAAIVGFPSLNVLRLPWLVIH